jgi:caffeoyl-CoA O-methyltransferase
MKAKSDAIIRTEQANYLDQLQPDPDALVAEMEAYAAAHHVPIADREVAIFLEITARANKAQAVLEIGMAIGYAVVHLVRGMGASGRVVTIEPNPDMIARAQGYYERAGISNQVQIVRGFALEELPKLNDSFDLLYLDALKEEYSQYLALALPLLRSGGVVIVDNLLWGGQVATQARDEAHVISTEALRQFNLNFVKHTQLTAQVLSIGDGLGYAVKL